MRQREGWPRALWAGIVSASNIPEKGTLGEAILQLFQSSHPEERPVVNEWRKALNHQTIPLPLANSSFGENLLPVPVPLIGVDGATACLMSWSPGSRLYSSLTDAPPIHDEVQRNEESQAEYYAECILGGKHGVDVSSIRKNNSEFETTPLAKGIIESKSKSEDGHLKNLGALSHYDQGTR